MTSSSSLDLAAQLESTPGCSGREFPCHERAVALSRAPPHLRIIIREWKKETPTVLRVHRNDRDGCPGQQHHVAEPRWTEYVPRVPCTIAWFGITSTLSSPSSLIVSLNQRTTNFHCRRVASGSTPPRWATLTHQIEIAQRFAE